MKKTLRISADLRHLEQIGNIVRDMLQAFPDEVYGVQLAVHECLTNVINHAYDGQDGDIDIALELKRRRFIAEVQDRGRGFDFDSVALPDLENGQVHGYGIFLIHQLMDDVSYRVRRNNNCWRLEKKLVAAT